MILNFIFYDMHKNMFLFLLIFTGLWSGIRIPPFRGVFPVKPGDASVVFCGPADRPGISGPAAA